MVTGTLTLVLAATLADNSAKFCFVYPAALGEKTQQYIEESRVYTLDYKKHILNKAEAQPKLGPKWRKVPSPEGTIFLHEDTSEIAATERQIAFIQKAQPSSIKGVRVLKGSDVPAEIRQSLMPRNYPKFEVGSELKVGLSSFMSYNTPASGGGAYQRTVPAFSFTEKGPSSFANDFTALKAKPNPSAPVGSPVYESPFVHQPPGVRASVAVTTDPTLPTSVQRNLRRSAIEVLNKELEQLEEKYAQLESELVNELKAKLAEVGLSEDMTIAEMSRKLKSQGGGLDPAELRTMIPGDLSEQKRMEGCRFSGQGLALYMYVEEKTGPTTMNGSGGSVHLVNPFSK